MAVLIISEFYCLTIGRPGSEGGARVWLDVCIYFCCKPQHFQHLQPLHQPASVTQSTLVAMAPKAEKKPAKKVAKSTSSAAAKKRKLAKAETYKIYIYKVLKQVRTPCFA
jgi:hypothetical protein